MTDTPALTARFDAALAAFPYPLAPTGIIQGALHPDPEGRAEYAAEFTFPAGRLLDQDLVAGGGIDLRREDGETAISALFGVARDGAWHDRDAAVLPEGAGIQGAFDPDTGRWTLGIDRY